MLWPTGARKSLIQLPALAGPAIHFDGFTARRPDIRPLSLEELRDVTDIWVETVLNLAPINLRKMEMLALAQDRLFEQKASRRFQKEF